VHGQFREPSTAFEERHSERRAVNQRVLREPLEKALQDVQDAEADAQYDRERGVSSFLVRLHQDVDDRLERLDDRDEPRRERRRAEGRRERPLERVAHRVLGVELGVVQEVPRGARARDGHVDDVAEGEADPVVGEEEVYVDGEVPLADDDHEALEGEHDGADELDEALEEDQEKDGGVLGEDLGADSHQSGRKRDVFPHAAHENEGNDQEDGGNGQKEPETVDRGPDRDRQRNET